MSTLTHHQRGSHLPRMILIALIAGLGAIGVAGPAHAADAYRYWGFYQLKEGVWGYATKGPAQITPADGAVDGYRFALVAGTAPRLPRAVLTFEEICRDTPAEDGKKRVGVVIDYGRTADAATAGAEVPQPAAQCAQADPKATSAQVLAGVVEVRDSKGLICALQGYPATGCADPVPAAKVSAQAKAADDAITIATAATATPSASNTTAATGTDSGGGFSTSNVLGVGAGVAVLAGLGAALVTRRRRGGDADQ